MCFCIFFFSSRRRHTRLQGDWSSDVCSSDLSARYGPPIWPASMHLCDNGRHRGSKTDAAWFEPGSFVRTLGNFPNETGPRCLERRDVQRNMQCSKDFVAFALATRGDLRLLATACP